MVSEPKIEVHFLASTPDPEVPAKARRRKFGAEDKKRILDEVDRAAGHGGIGAVLRREGVYFSTLYGWRKKRGAAGRPGFFQKRGAPNQGKSPTPPKQKTPPPKHPFPTTMWKTHT